MVINFCHPVFKTTVKCSTVSRDNYEASNLVSEDEAKRRQGFMADTFIRPPVDVTFQLPCKVQISHVTIYSRVGSQRSKGFELFSKIDASGSKHLKSTMEDVYFSIGRGYVDEAQKGLCFYNRRFCPRSGYANKCPRPSDLKELHLSSQHLNNTSGLIIKIFKTEGFSVPALAAVEIWGQPSFSCSEDVKKAIADKWLSTLSVPLLDESRVNALLQTTNEALCSRAESQKNLQHIKEKSTIEIGSDVEVPSDFFDPITCDIMSQPMVLPSGHVVDQLTIEKHNAREASWGQAPTNPFTGVLFTKQCYPIPDSSLKARIDTFLIKYGHLKELKNIPRTLGRKQLSDNDTDTNKIIKVSRKRQNDNSVLLGSPTTEKTFASSYNSKKTVNVPCRTHTTVSSSLHPGSSSLTKREQTIVKPLGRPVETHWFVAPKAGILPDGVVAVKLQLRKSHEQQVDESLKLSVKSSLIGLPTFLTPKNETVVHTPCCSDCLTKEYLFKLKCSHFICRTCLNKKTNIDLSESQKIMYCNSCSEPFTTADPCRYHV